MKFSTSAPRTRRFAAAAIGVAMTATALAGCGSSGDAAGGGSKAPYKIGVLTALTGDYSALGVPEKNAIDAYFKRVNAAGGIGGHPVKLVELDSQSATGTAVNQFRKLVTQDHVVAVLGPSSSGEGIGLQSFSLSMKTPTIVLASANQIVQPADKAKYIFMQYTPTQQSLDAQLAFAKSKGWTKVAYLGANNGYGQGPIEWLKDDAKKYGITLTGTEMFDPTATDVSAQLGKLGAGNPDAVLVWAVNPANAIVAKSAASIGFKPVLFNSPGGGDASYISGAGAAANNTYLQGSVVLGADSLPSSSPQYKQTHALLDDYKKDYGDVAGQFAANGWDGSILLQNAIEKAGNPDPSNVQAARDAIRTALESKTKDVPGVNGIYTFTADFHGSTPLTGLAVLQVQNNAFTIVKTY
ncbi:ABC transporter substrate-binding protein [Nocardioides sp.]|jgi:branched-chain amino acid transport system substrate-binding protein|uniref:ABC transporter substrate-binding protein n=1 Tax=Nocardioides sp. TaxID=35761 RepID=UPI002C91695F|nr:ABC transporter substrate-binding protein [Nocardioides sp.]HVX55243.1 ABC transporter substrate-binding protein [Nocardioides sp.]